jgi:hypothetical protein
LLTGGKPPTPELGKALEKWLSLRSPKNDDGGKPVPVPPVELEKLEAELREKHLAGDAILDGFAYYWQKLVNDPTPTPEKIENITAILERDRFADLPVTNEHLLLRRLAKTKLPAFAFPDAVRSLLQSEQAYCEALAATGGRLSVGFRHIQPLFQEANDRKQTAETQLFKPRPNSDELEAVHQQLKRATEQMKAVQTGALALRKAHRTAADAIADLHASRRSMIEWGWPSLDLWLTVAKQASELAERFTAAGPLEARDIEAIDALARKLRGTASMLALADAAKIKTLTENAQQRPESTSYTELQKLLAGPALSAEARAGIAAGHRKVSANRYGTIRAKFDKEHIRIPMEHPPWEDPFGRTRRRGHASIEFLRLSGSGSADKLDLAMRTAGTDSARWQTLADQLQSAWTTEIPKAAKEDAPKQRWHTVERILRAAPPQLDGFDREMGFGKLFELEEVARRKWLALRFGEYGKLRAGVPGAADFYSLLREEYDRPLARGGR